MNRYLFDTNIISETVRAKPNANVVNWLKSIPLSSSYISVLTVGELRKGVEKVMDAKRKGKLLHWLEGHVVKQFGDHIVDIDMNVADRWGRLCAESPRPLPGIDSLLAATALYLDMTLVTRNLKDFDIPGLDIINPWTLQ